MLTGPGGPFEVVVEARKNEYARYEAVGKPLWSKTSGWHTLEAVDDSITRLTFVEIYEVKNPILRRLFEKRVHAFISRDNDDTYRKENGVWRFSKTGYKRVINQILDRRAMPYRITAPEWAVTKA